MCNVNIKYLQLYIQRAKYYLSDINISINQQNIMDCNSVQLYVNKYSCQLNLVANLMTVEMVNNKFFIGPKTKI